MALSPLSMRVILPAVEAVLRALVWSDGGSADRVFNAVTLTAALDVGKVFQLATNAPAALVVDGGQRNEDADQLEQVVSVVSVGIVVQQPRDQFGREALVGDRGLYAIVERVLEALTYTQQLAGEVRWSASSAPAPVVRGDDPGGPILKELVFEVVHYVAR